MASNRGSRCRRTKKKSRPHFQHFDVSQLPTCSDMVWRRASSPGGAFGKTAPVDSLSPWFYVEVKIAAGRSAPLDADYEERAVYVVDGEVEISGDPFVGPQLLIFRPGDRITIRAKSDCRMMYLGGAALEGPRYIWWNFVSSSKDRIEAAKEDWKQGRFAPVPNETEFIPLPD